MSKDYLKDTKNVITDNHDQEFIKKIKEGVITRFQGLIGNTEVCADLDFLITENENSNGSWYGDAAKAEYELSLFSSVFERYQKWWIVTFGQEFEITDTDSAFCCMMIDAYRNVVDKVLEILITTDDNYDWDKNVEITETFVEEVKKTIYEAISELEDIFPVNN